MQTCFMLEKAVRLHKANMVYQKHIYVQGVHKLIRSLYMLTDFDWPLNGKPAQSDAAAVASKRNNSKEVCSRNRYKHIEREAPFVMFL